MTITRLILIGMALFVIIFAVRFFVGGRRKPSRQSKPRRKVEHPPVTRFVQP